MSACRAHLLSCLLCGFSSRGVTPPPAHALPPCCFHRARRYRDLLTLDPSIPIPFPAAILIRPKALCVNLESVRMIICQNQCWVLSGECVWGRVWGVGGDEGRLRVLGDRGLGGSAVCAACCWQDACPKGAVQAALRRAARISHGQQVPPMLTCAAPLNMPPLLPWRQCPRPATRMWRRSPRWTPPSPASSASACAPVRGKVNFFCQDALRKGLRPQPTTCGRQPPHPAGKSTGTLHDLSRNSAGFDFDAPYELRALEVALATVTNSLDAGKPCICSMTCVLELCVQSASVRSVLLH